MDRQPQLSRPGNGAGRVKTPALKTRPPSQTADAPSGAEAAARDSPDDGFRRTFGTSVKFYLHQLDARLIISPKEVILYNAMGSERRNRPKLFSMKVSGPEHGLIHAAADVAGYDSTSAWVRELVIREARDTFREALRPETPAKEEAVREPTEARA